jgi:hypothetical protein
MNHIREAPGLRRGAPEANDATRHSNPALWRLFAPAPLDTRHGQGVDERLRVLYLSGNEASWRHELATAADVLPEDGRMIVTFDRRASVAFLRFVARGRLERPRPAPLVRNVLRLMRSTGLEVEGAYRLWPSAESPSIAVTTSGKSAMRLMQRAGIMGGGANIWIRILARSRILTKLVQLVAPGIALVARRRRDA